MMSPTFIGFVFLLGILHVCSGKSVITASSVAAFAFFIGILQVEF